MALRSPEQIRCNKRHTRASAVNVVSGPAAQVVREAAVLADNRPELDQVRLGRRRAAVCAADEVLGSMKRSVL